MKRSLIILATLITIAITFLINIKSIYGSGPDRDNEKALEEFVQTVYDQRCKGAMTGEWKELKQYYDTSKKYGQWSYEYEAKRIKYLTDWSNNRGIEFIDIKSEAVLKKVRKKGDIYLLSITETYKFDYVYKDDIEKMVNNFGVCLKHSVGLIYKNDKWLINRDWYTDCFDDALDSYSGIYVGNSNAAFFLDHEEKVLDTFIGEIMVNKYNRQKAVEYADKYYAKYNSKYKDYNGIGGDCTNYVSQCLGDKEEGGGLAFDRTWFCTYPKYSKAEGSRAFVNADAFKAYLVYSGRGRVIKRGTFSELTKPTDNNPIGIVEKIQIGDLICFEKKGQIDHFSIVTAKDSKGYPMINSHTTDRYHVPFDLGWGSKTVKFHLIRIVH